MIILFPISFVFGTSLIYCALSKYEETKSDSLTSDKTNLIKHFNNTEILKNQTQQLKIQIEDLNKTLNIILENQIELNNSLQNINYS